MCIHSLCLLLLRNCVILKSRLAKRIVACTLKSLIKVILSAHSLHHLVCFIELILTYRSWNDFSSNRLTLLKWLSASVELFNETCSLRDFFLFHGNTLVGHDKAKIASCFSQLVILYLADARFCHSFTLLSKKFEEGNFAGTVIEHTFSIKQVHCQIPIS